jgi:uncharacterized caspase-like protein
MQYSNILLFIWLPFTSFTQPRIIIRPTLSATPSGFHPLKAQIFIRDPLNVKIFDWETARLSTLSLLGVQSSANSDDGSLTVWASTRDRGFDGFLIDHRNGSAKAFTDKEEKNAITGLHISPDNRYFVVESEQKIRLFSIETMHQIGVYAKKQERYNSCTFHKDYLFVWGKKELETLSLPDLKIIDKRPMSGNIAKLPNNGRYYMMDSKIFSTETHSLIGTIKEDAPIVPFPYTNTPLLSPDGKQAAVFYNLVKFTFILYDITSGKEILKKDLSQEIPDMISAMFFQVDPTWRFFAIANRSNGVTLFDIKTGKEKCQIYSIGPDDILITIPDGYYMATRRGAFEGVNFEMDGEIFDFAQFDQQYNRPDLVLEHIRLSPASTIARFKKAYQRRLERLAEQGLKRKEDNDFNLPVVEWGEELPIFTDKTALSLSFKATDKKEILDRINIYVNGVPLYGKNGLSLNGLKIKTYSQKVTIPLTEGDNRVEIEVVNQKMAISQRRQSIVRCEAKVANPALYLVTIGVQKYADSRQNLLFPANDVQKVQDLFVGKKGLYEKITIHRLWESDFTKEGLKKIKKELLRSKENDCVMVFYAGHGVVDHQFRYFLAGSTTDFQNPVNGGIPYELVENLLDSIPARKRLLMLDACFSGEIDKKNARRIKAENTIKGNVLMRSSEFGLVAGNTENERIFNTMREWFADLSVGTGATVLSSAGGQQEAAEGQRWQNGVFTWCLLEGLKDKKADANNDGKIMLSELRSYLENAVPNQTDRKQQPTFRAENLINDWQIW